jgi:hypothetical protein
MWRALSQPRRGENYPLSNVAKAPFDSALSFIQLNPWISAYQIERVRPRVRTGKRYLWAFVDTIVDTFLTNP